MGVRARCEHFGTESGKVVKVELVGKTYSGSVLDVVGPASNWAKLSYDQLGATDIFDTPVQRARLAFSYFINDSNSLALLNEIIGAGQGEYTLNLYNDNVLLWTGEVMLDQLGSIAEGEPSAYPFTVTAKDLTVLERTLFPLEDQRETIITVLGRILSSTGYDLPIWTHTSWVATGTTSGNDFLRQIYMDTRNLRDFGRDGVDAQITMFEALERILRSHRLFLQQLEGKFVISQMTAFRTPSAVLRTVYDKDGAYQSQSSVDVRQSANDQMIVVKGSSSEVKPGYKRITSTYLHRTPDSSINIPSVVELSDFTAQSFSYEQAFEIQPLNINQRVSVTGTAFVRFDDPQLGSVIGTEPRVGVRVEFTSNNITYYWNDSFKRWQTSAFTNQFATRSQQVGKVDELDSQLFQDFVASISITTGYFTEGITNLLDGFGVFKVTLFRSSATTRPSKTFYEGMDVTFGGDTNEKLSQGLQYTLTQQFDFSQNYNAGNSFFGDGPLTYSPSALRTGTGDTALTSEWNFRGESDDFPHHEIGLREIMNVYREWSRVMTASIKTGNYSPLKVLVYELKFFNFIGGTFNGTTGWWTPILFENEFIDSSTDLLDLGIIAGPSLITSGIFTASQFNRDQAIEQVGIIPYRLRLPISGTITQIFVTGNNDAPFLFKKGDSLRVTNPITLDSVTLTVAQDQPSASTVIAVESAQVDPFPAGSYVFVSDETIQAGIAIGRDAVRIFAEATAIGVTTQESLGPVTSLPVRLNTRVRAGDDLYLINADTGGKSSFTVGQTAGPGLVTLQLELETVFDAALGSYIVGSNAQYEAFLQVTPSGVLAKAEAVSVQNAVGVLSAPLPAGTYTSIPVTSVRTLKLQNGTALGVQDKAGNTVFFTVNGTQDLTNATTTITVNSATTAIAVDAGAAVFQPMWNQTAQLSVQADQIALRVTETQVQALIDENLGGLLPAENWLFEGTDEGFTTNNVTLTTDTDYIEYLATGSTPYIQKTGLSIDADDNPVVTIRVQRIAGTNWGGAFGWTTDGTNYFTRVFTEPTGVDADFQFATIDLTSNTDYTGTVTGVRLFLGEANLDEFYIDQFIIGKFNPQTEILADLSSRLTVAEGAITVESNRIDLFTQKSSELNRIAEVNATYNQSSTYTSIALTNTRSGFEVRNGQVLYLVNVDGTFQSVTVNGNQTLTTAVTIASETFVTTILPGAMLYEAGFSASSRITQQAGQIVLKAQESAGEVTSLALVRLDASASSGSAVTIQGDLVAINNIQITRGVGSAAGVIQTSNFVAGTSGWRIRGGGDAEFNNVTVRGSVFVTGGNIDAAIPFGASGEIRNTNSNPDVVISNTGITLKQIDASNDTEIKRSIHWINSTDTTLQSRLVSYASGSNIAIDAAGTENAKDFRFSVRRNISATRDFDIGISGNNGAFNNNSLVGDTVMIAQGKILIQGSSATTIIGLVVNNGRVGVGNLGTDTSYKFNVTGNSLFTGTITSTGNFSTTGNVTGNDIVANGVVGTARVQTVDARFFSAASSFANYAQVEYNGTANRTYTIPFVANSNFVMSEGTQTINGAKTFGSAITSPSLIVGSQTNKATIAYTTNTARTYTIPNVNASDFVMTAGAQTIAGVKAFSSRIDAQSDIRLLDSGAQQLNLSGTGSSVTENRTYTFPDASGEFVITAGNQDIAGTKRFTGTLRASAYRSSDNTAGATDTITVTDVNLNAFNLIFKNGLFVGTS